MKKKILILITAAVTVISAAVLAGCGGSDPDQSSSQDTGITGTTVNAGKVSALCPEGWTSFEVTDVFDGGKAVPEMLRFVKGAASEEDMYDYPYLEITRFTGDDGFPDPRSNRKFLGDYTEAEDMTVGGRVWHVAAGTSLDIPLVQIWTDADEDENIFLINVWTSMPNGSIAIDSDEVQAIIGSVSPE